MIQVRTALFALLLAASLPGWAQNVLVITPFDVGSNAQADANFTRLQDILSSFDFNVQRAVAIPDFGTLQNYEQIWDVWAVNTEAHPAGKPLTAVEIALYVEYLASGGRLVVFGDHSGFPTRNDSVIALIQAAGAGTLTFTTPTHTEGTNQSPQIIQPPFTGPQVIGDGNNEVTFIAAGGTTNAGKGRFISKDNVGRGTALVFSPGTMANAMDGTLIVIFDQNILDEAGPTRPDFADYGSLLHNITDYLQNVQALPPLPDVAALQCREGATGPLQTCSFNTPLGVAARNGNVYVTDTALHAVYRIDPTTQQKVLIAGLQIDPLEAPDVRYNGDGIDGRMALLNNPTGLALDAAGNLYIADTGNHAIRRLAADANGVIPDGAVITTVAGVPTQFGVGDPLLLFGPRGMGFDEEGNLFIADTMNQQIRMLAADGTLSVVAGIAGFPGGNNGPVACTPPCATPPGRLNKPVGVAIDSAGTVFVADEGNNQVRMISDGFVGSTTTANPLRRPTAVVLAPGGTTLLAADYGNHVIRQVAPCDDCSSPDPDVVAGTDGEAGSSGPALNSPIGISVDGFTLYIADLLNNRIGRVPLSD
jgi:sugar lactone lactonase YvrE